MEMPRSNVFMTPSVCWPLAAEMWRRTISATPLLASRAWWNSSFCFSSSCSCETPKKVFKSLRKEKKYVFVPQKNMHANISNNFTRHNIAYKIFRDVL
jgi:hypothetical protein